MSIAITAAAAALLLISLPVIAELSLFLFANLFLRRRVPKGKAEAAKALRLAVLIPAHDEEKCIGRCVSSLLESDPGLHHLEIIVIADNCGDQTAAVARAAGSRVLARENAAVRGKGAAIDYAITTLMSEDHDAFIVIDADSVVGGNFIRAMGDRFAEGADALQCADLPLNPEASPRIRLMNLALLSMNYFRPMGRELLGCSVGIFGNGFGLRKDLLVRVPYKANSITEDIEYHLRIVESGRKVRFVGETRVLADFPVSKEGSQTQRERWEGGRFMLQRKLSLTLLGKILSGKLRLIEPFLELMSLPLSYEVLLLSALAIVPGHPFRAYGIGGLCVILAQIIAAIVLYGSARDLLAVLQVPSYLFWKVARLPGILRTSRRNSAWIRTKRD